MHDRPLKSARGLLSAGEFITSAASQASESQILIFDVMMLEFQILELQSEVFLHKKHFLQKQTLASKKSPWLLDFPFGSNQTLHVVQVFLKFIISSPLILSLL